MNAISFDLCLPLGLTLTDVGSSEGEVRVLSVESGSQASKLGVMPRWVLAAVGERQLMQLEDGMSLVNSIVSERKQKIKALKDTRGDFESLRYLDFHFKYGRSGKVSKEIQGEEDEEGTGVIDAFSGYSSPKAKNSKKQSRDTKEEKRLLRKMKELHEGLVKARRENNILQKEVRGILAEHDKVKAEWVDREKRALAETRKLKKELGDKATRSIWSAKGVTQLKTQDSQRRRKSVKTSQRSMNKTKTAKSLGHDKKKKKKQPFSSGISTTSHRFNSRKQTGAIRIPPELLKLPVFDEDFPKPVFKIKLTELQQRG
mmetsp:Transcript_40922/g.65791  ORF Transcript_40922/g.65791 Transcript_40922/m.65791 type:complete len:315 (+) Transcript_40922:242-1186(+)